MAVSCETGGACPRCGYANKLGEQRCVRCKAILMVPAGCDGNCTRCFVQTLAPGLTGQSKPQDQG